MSLPNISIIVIGFNEAKNLDNTFSAIQNMNYPQDNYEIIYVDSGSADSSIEIAQKYTDKIFIEDKFPSPGRNRNRGLVEAKYDIVHFIDGDITIGKEYLNNIVFLFEKKNVQAVSGQLEEQTNSFFNLLAHLQCESQEGYKCYTTTGGTYLKKSLMSVDGYDERLMRAEESELAERFHRKGFNAWKTNIPMGEHNFGINNFWQYVQRYKANGKTMVQNAFLKGRNSYFLKTKKQFARQVIKLILMIIICIYSIVYQKISVILIWLVLSWLSRNKGVLRKILKKETCYPLRHLWEIILNFFFYWLWWYGFFYEVARLLFLSSEKEFFKLDKMKLC